MNALAADTRAAYELWAPRYPPVAHNPVMRAEQAAILRHWPAVRGLRALDLACGSGRYTQLLSERCAAHVIALDFCMPMLQQVRATSRVCASMMQLPFAAESFDVVISGLAAGHAPDIGSWTAEAARVLRGGGTLLYSDFHPQAAAAGFARSFKDADERRHCVPHQNFGVAAQVAAAEAADLSVEDVYEVRIGREIREPFTGSVEFYRRWDGLPVVLVVRASKRRR
jgi:malonyl-CoA O-methyltransferase